MNFRQLANEHIGNLTPYQSGKPIEELERELGITSSIKLASNENPLGASPKAIAAATQALTKAHIYPDSSCYELKHKLADFLTVQPNQLTIGNGSENILELIIKSYLHKGDSAVISQFAFISIPIMLQAHGVNTKVAPAVQWGHSIENMLSLIDEKTRVLFLVNPNNPTGTYTHKKDFELLLKSVPPHVVVVIDEAYAEYIDLADYPDTLSYLSKHTNLVITRTFSKIYGLAGLRLGYAISSADIADILNRARLPFNVNAIAAKAGCAALDDTDFVRASIVLNQAGKQQLEMGLKKLSLDFIPSIGNFITIDVGDGQAVYEALLRKGVIVRPLLAYGMPKHVRVTIGTEAENTRFLNAIK